METSQLPPDLQKVAINSGDESLPFVLGKGRKEGKSTFYHVSAFPTHPISPRHKKKTPSFQDTGILLSWKRDQVPNVQVSTEKLYMHHENLSLEFCLSKIEDVWQEHTESRSGSIGDFPITSRRSTRQLDCRNQESLERIGINFCVKRFTCQVLVRFPSSRDLRASSKFSLLKTNHFRSMTHFTMDQPLPIRKNSRC